MTVFSQIKFVYWAKIVFPHKFWVS